MKPSEQCRWMQPGENGAAVACARRRDHTGSHRVDPSREFDWRALLGVKPGTRWVGPTEDKR